MTWNVKPAFCLAVAGSLLFAASCNPASQKSGEQSQDSSSASTASAAWEDGFVRIFDGKSLSGCEGDTSLWRAEAGSLGGELKLGQRLKTHTIIFSTQKPKQ